MRGERDDGDTTARRLVRPPTRLDLEDGGYGVMYLQLADSGEAEVRLWRAGSPEEREEIRRFEEAAAAIDWDVPGAHEVRWEPLPRRNPRLAAPEGPRGGGPEEEDEAYDRVALDLRGDSVPLPTPADLDAFERDEGFPLPESYRRFVLRFGPGTFPDAGEIAIASPGYPKTLQTFDLARLNRRHRAEDWSDEELRDMHGPNTARVRRLILFGSDSGNNRYGWDPRDATDPNRRECGVYKLPRIGAVRRVARSFAEFVSARCLGRGKKGAYHAHHDVFIRQYEVAAAFLAETGWPLEPGRDVADFAHDLGSHMHCSPRDKLSRAFKAWTKDRPGPDPYS